RDAELDTHLRFEIQDRRAGNVRLIHENGYRACDVRQELERALCGLAVESSDFAGVLRTYPPNAPHRVAYAGASLYLYEHPPALSVVRNEISRRASYGWRRKARSAGLYVGAFGFPIDPHLFEAGSSL